jgi:hypothetical protein
MKYIDIYKLFREDLKKNISLVASLICYLVTQRQLVAEKPVNAKQVRGIM